jgi:asparaginyl-tRNA synthetase
MEQMIDKGGYIRDIFNKPVGTLAEACGWVKTRRDSKGVSFIQLNDGSSFQDLQVVVDAGTIPRRRWRRRRRARVCA